MIQERYEQAHSLLSEHLKENGIIEIGCSYDPSSKEYNGLTIPRLNRESDKVKNLESLGFKVIYPAQLTKQEVDRMDDVQKGAYNAEMSTALVIDGSEKCLSLNLENIIAEHYFYAGMPDIAGLDSKSNSIVRYPRDEFPPETNANYKELLDDIGFQTEMDEKGIVTISSDIPYPAVKKSKFEQIYDKAKEKIQGVFAKLKDFVNPKDKIKENNTNERG